MDTSGSRQFDALRSALIGQPGLRAELESALLLNVQRVNPTDRANRFGSGAAVEWILAAVAFAAGVITLPGGHNLNGFDLQDFREASRGLWSVKNQTKKGDFRISNGLGGGGRGLVDATVFLSPALPGLTFLDPARHLDAAARAKSTGDAVVLPFSAVAQHATDHPECVAPCAMPANPGTGTDDPWMDYVENLLTGGRFPLLAQLFVRSAHAESTLTSELKALAQMRRAGELDERRYQLALDRLLD